MKKMRNLLILVLVAVFAFTACSPKSETQNEDNKQEDDNKQKNVLNFNLKAEPKTIDPGLNGAIVGSHLINNMYEGLTREINGELTNAMAETIDISEDGLEYTFHLRDAEWSDGQPVTADQFEYAWKRVLDPASAANYASHMFYIKNAQAFYNGEKSIDEVALEAIDEKTLKVTLESPTPYFLTLLTRPAFMPLRKEIIEEGDERWSFDPEKVVTNGPFKLEEYTRGDRIVLVKNDQYWNKDAVKLDQINCSMIVEASTALTAYESGEVDIIDNVPPQEIMSLMATDDTLSIIPQLGTYYISFNVNQTPTDDVRVRKALSLAIDRKAITDNITKGGELPATGFNPAQLLDSKGNEFNSVAGDYGINVDGGDVAKAQELLTEAGYPNGEGFPELTVLFNTSESHSAVFQAIQEMWKTNLGIDVKLSNQEWAVFDETRIAGNFDMARGGYIVDYPDPVGMLELMVEGSRNNHAHWVNDEYNNLINESRNLAGEARDEMLYKAEGILMEEGPVAPIYYYTQPVMVKEHVVGWEMNSLSYWYFGNVDIQ